MTISIKIKCSLQNREKWKDLLCILKRNDIGCSKLISGSGIFTAICNSICDADRIFGDVCLQELSNDNYHPVMPPELRAKRCVIASRLDSFLAEFSVEDLIREINQQNPSLQVIEIYKLSSGRMLKLVFKSQEMAVNCLSKGIYLYNLSIPPSSLRADSYVKLNYCYRCYSIEDHMSRDCPKPAEYMICSICSSLQHNYKDCSSNFKKCINCDGQHNTMSIACPARKPFIIPNSNVNNNYGTGKTSYTTTPVSFTSTLKSNPQADRTCLVKDVNSMMIKAFMCFMCASNANTSQPGSFCDVLEKLLKVNNLPDFNFGDIDTSSFMVPTSMFNLANLTTDVSVSSCDLQSQSTVADDALTHTNDSSEIVDPATHVNSSAISEDSKISSSSRKKSKNCTVFVRKGGTNNGNIDNISSNESIIIQHNCQNASACRKYNGNLRNFLRKGTISVIELNARNFNIKKNTKAFRGSQNNLIPTRVVTRAGSASSYID